MTTDDLPSLDSATLDAVTGGVTSTSASNAQLLAAQQGITSASLYPQASQSPVAPLPALSGGPGGMAGPCPCGCGMASCMRR